MAKLKLGAIADDKPVKVTHELPASVHRDLVAMPKLSRDRADNRLVIQSSSSHPCLRGSWQRIERLPRSAVRVNFPNKVRGSVRRAASERFPGRGFRYPFANKLNSSIRSVHRRPAVPDIRDRKEWRPRPIPERG